MNYNVYYSGKAENDLHGIFQYIAYNLSAPIAAKKQADDIIDEISKLSENPLRYPLYKREPWRSKGLRFFLVNNYIVFYLLEEDSKNVIIVRIMYGGRNVDTQLNN